MGSMGEPVMERETPSRYFAYASSCGKFIALSSLWKREPRPARNAAEYAGEKPEPVELRTNRYVIRLAWL